jgi:hypothetical protein
MISFDQKMQNVYNTSDGFTRKLSAIYQTTVGKNKGDVDSV